MTATSAPAMAGALNESLGMRIVTPLSSRPSAARAGTHQATFANVRDGSRIAACGGFRHDSGGSQPQHRVPFLVEDLALLSVIVPVLRENQLVFGKLLPRGHRRRIVGERAVIQVRVILIIFLPARRHR